MILKDIQRFINMAIYYYPTSALGQSGLRLSPIPILASSVGIVREKVLRTSALFNIQRFINLAIHTNARQVTSQPTARIKN